MHWLRCLWMNMPDFYERVKDHFACLKEKPEKLQYKWLVSVLLNGEFCWYPHIKL